ncbi:MAG: four helix bundle protein [Candidatus Ryanbacteria bacterium]|nr:four helix bundle protein [Candidatus Ryanbacteria bacterium]
MSEGYKDLIVWQKGKSFCINIYKLTENFPNSEQFGLVSQLRRAAVSIPSNIAEGSKRNTRKDQNQFYAVAYGSGAEVETQLSIAKELFPKLKIKIENLEEDLIEIMKMLNKLRSVNQRL